jgi:hypothetical protein
LVAEHAMAFREPEQRGIAARGRVGDQEFLVFQIA